MSRIGNKSIEIPAGVSIDVTDGIVTVKGKKETLSTPLVDTTEISVEDNVAKVLSVPEKSSLRLKAGKVKARHGLMRALLNNMVTGVSTGFVKELEFHGIGYKVDVRGKELVLNVGYSNPRIHVIPDGISAEVVKGAKVPTLKLSSSDKELLGKVASEVRKHRTPDSYKGKGIRYKGEVVRLKAGKSK
jgi:large subunit ribosomal protein L6